MAKELFDYLINGKTLNEFLDDFPDISKDETIAVLSQILDAHNGRRAGASLGRYAGLGAELAA
jgi:predicted transcriptional regulator